MFAKSELELLRLVSKCTSEASFFLERKLWLGQLIKVVNIALQKTAALNTVPLRSIFHVVMQCFWLTGVHSATACNLTMCYIPFCLGLG